ncbi:hypothetical protein LZS94_10820 [Aliivibrio fischeri]|uniref:haloacid dehalogenase-like hydrolase n=1 Tax=Aliivibrio fischeri TaxID=668 RepID=UPI001F2DDEDB|nr:hypothetical protein [Aliivibrio fischeri]MCE7577990.1 hypothetical protein [Aliivibrio fischeri]MCE7590378.1 hypothetical protein [Aliivibrio fischeri]
MYVFDLCGTLVRSNTTFTFVSYVTRREKDYTKYLISLFYRTFIFKVIMLFLRRFSISHRDLVIRLLSGYLKDDLVKYASDYAEIELKYKSNQNVVYLLKLNAKRSLIASASLDVIVDAFCTKLNVKKSISANLLYSEYGICLGLIDKDNDPKGNKDKLLKIDNLIFFATDNYDDYLLCYEASKILILTKKKSLSYWHKVMDNCEAREIEIYLK